MRYAKALIEDGEYNVEITWAELTDAYEGRSRDKLRETLVHHRRQDLIDRIDRNSGVKPNKRYLARLCRTIAADPEVTWGTLSVLFDNRTQEQLSKVLYKHGQNELVRQVTEATRKVETK